MLAAYVLMLREPYVPDIAGHLIACSVMCAPASLVIAKLMLPESRAARRARPPKRRRRIASEASGLLDAITTGTIDGLQLAVNVGAMLIAFLALTALVNCLPAVARRGACCTRPLSLSAARLAVRAAGVVDGRAERRRDRRSPACSARRPC